MVKSLDQFNEITSSSPYQVLHLVGQRPIIQLLTSGLTLDIKPALFVKLVSGERIRPFCRTRCGASYR